MRLSPNERLAAGALVSHPLFGRGTVLSGGNSLRARVKFPKAGIYRCAVSGLTQTIDMGGIHGTRRAC